jgi:hypothetical protein
MDIEPFSTARLSPLGRGTAKAALAIHQAGFLRAVEARSEAQVAHTKVFELGYVADAVGEMSAFVRARCDRRVAGDPFCADEQHLIAQTYTLGALRILGNLVEAYDRESRRHM